MPTGLARGGKDSGEEWTKNSSCLFTEKDATTDFEDIGHSEAAIEMLDKYYVGDVDTSTIPAKDEHSPPPRTQAPAATNESSGFVIKILQFLLPLLILGLAFALQYYGKRSKSATHED